GPMHRASFSQTRRDSWSRRSLGGFDDNQREHRAMWPGIEMPGACLGRGIEPPGEMPREPTGGLDGGAKQPSSRPPLEWRRAMNPTIDRAGSQSRDMMPIIVATIRAISAQARAVTITPESLLLEELALDSLDLVAVILRLQDHFQVEVDPDDIPSLRTVGD